MRKKVQQQNRTQKDNSITQAGSQKASPRRSVKENPLSKLQRTIGNQAVSRMLQSRGQVARASEPQLQRKADEAGVDPHVNEPKDDTWQTGTQNMDRNGNSDAPVHWWNPFGERIAKWGFGGIVTYVNVDRKTVAEYTGPWQRNALDAGLFAVVTGVATEVALKRLKLIDMVSKAVGLGVAFGMGYEGLDVRERIRCKTIDSYSWYGRYRYNYADSVILAVEYWDKGPTQKSMVSPVYFEQAIVNADEKVLFVYPNELSYSGIDLDAASTTLPLFSYGKVDKD